MFGFGISHRKAQRKGWAFPFGVGGAVYVMPAKRVARLGASICGRVSVLCNCFSICLIVNSKERREAWHLGLPFDCAARRCARFSLVSCIWFPFNGGDIASDRDALGVPTASNT